MRRPVSERLYRILLRCYPGEFRDDYQREMLQAFRERLDADRRAGPRALARLWWQLLADSFVRAPGEHLDVLRQDVRYGLRSLRRAPAFALTAVGTLALGIGANTAIFSVVHAVALQALPFDPANRLVRLWERNDGLSLSGFSVSVPNYLSWRERARTLEISAWLGGSVTLRTAGDPVRVRSMTGAAPLFRLLGVTPVAGRLLTADDEAPGSARVAMISEALWRRQFGGSAETIGSPVTIGTTAHTIVGIVPDDSVPADAEFFLPMALDPSADRDNRVAQVLGRLHDGVTLEQARAEMDDIARQLETAFPESNRGWGVTMSTAYDWIVPPETRTALLAVLGAVGCVLLIACANVANLMLARAAARRRELALRMAIGAARRRLIRQVLTEGLLLTALGGAAGVLLAWWMMPVLRQWMPATLPRADEAAVNTPVLLFSVGICIATGLAFAMLPALSGARRDVIDALKDGTRGATPAGNLPRQLLAVGQVTLATILLVGAGLLVQSLLRLQRVELGFDPARVTTAMIGLQSSGRYERPGEGWGFYQRLLERLAGAPGIEGAAISSGAPFGGGNTGMPINAVGPSRMQGTALQTDWRMVSPGYFQTMGIPLLRGRHFTGSATSDRNTLIVSSAMARRMWGEDDPLGRQITAGPNGTFTVVGVAGDVRNLDLSLDPAPTMYLPTAQYLWPSMTIVVRPAAGQPHPAALIRAIVRELDPQLALHNVRDMEPLIAQSAAQPRLNASLVGLFAVIAALLAALGIYGVLAYLVSLRRQEIGIRMALGAARSSVLGLFLTRGVKLAAVGLGLGVAGAFGVSRWIESMLFGVRARDPWTFGTAVAAIAAITLLASYVPARRAARLDPIAALRAE